jgi:hypothetical protein
MKKSIWFCSSSFIILILPILVQLEFSQVAEIQAAQTRQVKSSSHKVQLTYFYSHRFFLAHPLKSVLVKNNFMCDIEPYPSFF